MRRVLLAVLVTAVSLSVAQPAFANHGVDLDCADFAFREDAQEHFNAHPGDPDGLDGNDNDRLACEHLPRRPAPRQDQVVQTPGYPPGPAPTVVVQAPLPPTPVVRPARARVAFTGADILPWAGTALGLLALGTGLVVAARRRRA